MERRLKISILLIGILGLSILMCACHAPWDIRNIDAESVLGGVYYSPDNDEINVEIRMTEEGSADICISVFSEDFPLSLVQEISISKFRLETDQKEYVLDGQYNEKMSIKDGVGRMTVSIDAVPSTACRLIITELTGHAKGEGPLFISGNWTN